MFVSKIASVLALLSVSQAEAAFEEVNYDEFIGVWHSCLETSHMTFSGVAQDKHTHQNEKCRKIQMANITYVGDENGMDNTGFEKVTQILQLEHVGLNHCEFWGMAGAKCPNATWANNDRGEEGTVMYIQNFHSIGSYLTENHLKFYGEEKHAIDIDGSLVQHPFDAIEDQDFFDCKYDAKLKGLVCDTRQNEYRNGSDGSEEKEGWKSAYNDFGTYYMVKDMAHCKFCSDYECTDSGGKFDITNMFGLATLKKVTCNNIGKIENEHVKKGVCDSHGFVKKQGKVPEMKMPVKELCPNVCGECMD